MEKGPTIKKCSKILFYVAPFAHAVEGKNFSFVGGFKEVKKNNAKEAHFGNI